MILRGRERQRRLAVDQREEARLLTGKEFLDDEFGAGLAEGAGETGIDGGFGSLLGLGDGHALAGGKPVGLDDDRLRLLRDISLGSFGVLEASIGSSRYAGTRAEVLGEALGAFEPRSLARRTEDLDALGFEVVGEPGDERRLWPDDDEADVLFLAEARDRRMVRDVEGDAFRRSRRCRHCPARNRACRARGFA